MSDYRPLDEIDSYVLFSEHEEVFLFDKDLNREVWRIAFYGNASCGLLGQANWAVIGGEQLIIWIDSKLQEISDPELRWIHDLRRVGDYEIEILIDPWTEISAIWRFNLRTLSKTKVRDFKDYYNKPFEENVKW